MARKKKHPEHVNHERWLISYADFITLLFAFFVVMFVVSQVDTAKVGRFTQSFQEAIGIQLATGGAGILPGEGSSTTASSLPAGPLICMFSARGSAPVIRPRPGGPGTPN